MEDKIESRTDKLTSQPNDRRDNDDKLDLNDAVIGVTAKATAKATDQDSDKSSIDPADIASVQQPSDVSHNDLTYEQLNSLAQERVNDAIDTLTDAQSNLACVLAHDLFHELASGKKIYSDHATHTGITIDNYNKMIDTISDLKSLFNSK